MDLNFWKATVNKGGGERRRKEVAERGQRIHYIVLVPSTRNTIAIGDADDPKFVPSPLRLAAVARAAPHGYTLLMGALATATAQPVGTLPGVPTAAQAGLKDFEVSSMFGMLAPAGTPVPIVTRLNTALKGILSQQDVRDSMLAQGAAATYTTPEEAGVAIRNEVAKWAKVVKDGDIRGD